jgi:hypothetical protein
MLSRLAYEAEAIVRASEGRPRTLLENEALYIASLAAKDAQRLDLSRRSAARALDAA